MSSRNGGNTIFCFAKTVTCNWLGQIKEHRDYSDNYKINGVVNKIYYFPMFRDSDAFGSKPRNKLSLGTGDVTGVYLSSNGNVFHDSVRACSECSQRASVLARKTAPQAPCS